MGKINYGRVILGGVVGGIVAFLLDVVGNGFLFRQQWLEANKSLNRTEGNLGVLLVCMFLVWIVAGALMVWVYAAIRPRFGSGMRTAVYTGLVPWVFGSVLPDAINAAGGLYSARFMFYLTIFEIVPMVACAVVGAWLYKEAESTAAYPATAPQATR
jgi:hypothetical protein